MKCGLLVVMIVLTVLYGCGQASKPVERAEKQHGLDKQAREQETSELAPHRDIIAHSDGGLTRKRNGRATAT